MSVYLYKPPRPNKFPGACVECGGWVPANGGFIRRNRITGKYDVRHHVRRVIMPTGPWDRFEPYEVGGCPPRREEVA